MTQLQVRKSVDEEDYIWTERETVEVYLEGGYESSVLDPNGNPYVIFPKRQKIGFDLTKKYNK